MRTGVHSGVCYRKMAYGVNGQHPYGGQTIQGGMIRNRLLHRGKMYLGGGGTQLAMGFNSPSAYYCAQRHLKAHFYSEHWKGGKRSVQRRET